ncbi:MAG TPA: glycosyltransferase family 39 protein [Solirubrobacteraceae bacterium]|nr:glycosyltransferase family 39 protein [Solirubrobacteraceae bacterium]
MSTATIEPVLTRTPRPAVRERFMQVLPVLAPSALAALIVLYELGTRSLWLDESATVAITAQHGSALWEAIARDGGNMLGYYLLLHALTGAFGHAPALIRAPSVVGFVGTVAITSMIAQRLFGRRAALAAGLLTAVSLPLVFWGQDARGYALMTMFVAASFLALIALVEQPRSRRAWAAYIAMTLLAMYMSFVAVLVLPAQLVVLLTRREAARAVLSAVAVLAACCVPIAVLAVLRGSSQLFWVPAPNLKRIGEMARWLTSAGMPPNFHRTATGTIALVVTLALVAALLAAAIPQRRRIGWPVWLTVAWLLVPLGLSLAESLAGQPIQLARNSLLSLPAVALVLAWGLTHPRISPWLGVSALGALLALRALQLAPSYGVSSENWKAATQRVITATRPGDCIAFYPSDGRMAFAYYIPTGAQAPAPVLPGAAWGVTKPYVERYVLPSASRLAQIEASCARVWLIASHQGFRNGPPGSRAHFAQYQKLRGTLSRAYGPGFTASYGWASPVRVELFARLPAR